MSAKHKLNAAHLNGALITASTVGYISGSVVLFVIAFAWMVSEGLHNGNIRR